jgi:hypothetical protein
MEQKLNEIDDKLFETVKGEDIPNTFAENDEPSPTETEPDDSIYSSDMESEPEQGNITQVNAAQVVQGRFVVELLDKLMPSVLVVGTKYLGYNATKKQFAFTKSEREDMLIPVTDAYLQSVDIKLTPLQALMVAFGSVYAGKFIEVMEKGKGAQPMELDDPNANNIGAKKRTYKPRAKKV